MGAAMLIMRIIARSIAPRASPMRSPVSSHSLLSPPLACFHLQLTSSWLGLGEGKHVVCVVFAQRNKVGGHLTAAHTRTGATPA